MGLNNMAIPKWANKKESTKSIANKKENKVYKSILSGALDVKGDFNTSDSCVDLKSTEKNSIRITTKQCDKLISDSLANGKKNAIFILDLPDYYIIGKVQKKLDKN